MNMPSVLHCNVEQCAYNQKKECHALAITIGHGAHPHCDTFCAGPAKGGDASAMGKVGACKVESCKFNTNLECSAAGINVGFLVDDADCQTFQARP